MENNGVKHGLLAGLAAIIITLLFYLVSERMLFTVSGYLCWAAYIGFMVKAALDEREQNGGFLSFKEGLKPTFLTYVIASLLYMAFYYVLFNFIDTSLLDMQKEIAVETIEKMGGLLGEEGLEAAMESLEEQDFSMGIGQMTLGYMIGLIFPGFIFAAIISLIVKRNRPEV